MADVDGRPPALPNSEVSAAVERFGWRVVLSTLLASVPVESSAQALDVARVALDASGPDADAHLRLDLRAERVELAVATFAHDALTARDVEIAASIHAALSEAGFRFAAASGVPRPVQTLEIAIDALDVAAIHGFWRAVLGYVDAPKPDGGNPLVDPAGQAPTLWFQQMDEPRRQRNRIHFDIVVAHDEAEARIAAALEAGGVLVSDDEARAFWILADAEGNEICVCTWQDRD